MRGKIVRRSRIRSGSGITRGEGEKRFIIVAISMLLMYSLVSYIESRWILVLPALSLSTNEASKGFLASQGPYRCRYARSSRRRGYRSRREAQVGA